MQSIRVVPVNDGIVELKCLPGEVLEVFDDAAANTALLRVGFVCYAAARRHGDSQRSAEAVAAVVREATKGLEEKLHGLVASHQTVVDLALRKVSAAQVCTPQDVASSCARLVEGRFARTEDAIQSGLETLGSAVDRLKQDKAETVTRELKIQQTSALKGRRFEDDVTSFLRSQGLSAERRTNLPVQGGDITVTSACGFPWIIEAKDVKGSLRASELDKFYRDVEENSEADLFVLVTRTGFSVPSKRRSLDVVGGKLVILYDGPFEAFQRDYNQLVNFGKFVSRLGAGHKRVAEIVRSYEHQQVHITSMRKHILLVEKSVASMKENLGKMSQAFRQEMSALADEGALAGPWSKKDSVASLPPPDSDDDSDEYTISELGGRAKRARTDESPSSDRDA